MDSYRTNRCGSYQMNTCHNTNPRCVYQPQPIRNRRMTPDCDTMPDYDRKPDCNRMPDCGRKPDCDRMPDCDQTPDCNCGDRNKHMAHMPVGIGYVPMQKWEKMYEPVTVLCQGTAFPSLNLIFCGVRG